MKEKEITVPYDKFKRASQEVARKKDIAIRMIREKDRGIIEIDSDKRRKREPIFDYERYGDSIELKPAKTETDKIRDLQEEIRKRIRDEGNE